MSSMVVPAYPCLRNNVRAASSTAVRVRTTRGSSALGPAKRRLPRLARTRKSDIALMGEIIYPGAKSIAKEENMDSDHAAVIPRSLLGYGVLAGPFYLTVGLAQAFVRDGYDFGRHALSHLANGPGGWVQTANFLLTGLMVLAAAVGFSRVLGKSSRAFPWLLGAFGASLIVAAAFRADPVDGFPPGTPEGFPTSISTTGLIHFVAGALGFTFLGVSCFVAARTMSRRGARSLGRLSFLAGVVVLLGFFGGPFLSSAGILGIWISVVVGWAWLVVLSWQLARRRVA